jgi:hypothetical protein
MIGSISIYSIALFLHIVGALGLFVAIGLEWASLSNLRRVETGSLAREWFKLFASLRRLYPFSWTLILIPGFYMAATVWRGVAWISIALASVVLLVVLGAALGGRLLAPVGRALSAESGPLSTDLRQQIDKPLLWASLRTRTAIALGIVFLMTAKPDLIGSSITMVVAVLLGLAFSLPIRVRNREQVQVKQAGDQL